jgi:integral membrane protein (TIGR01906 family)
MKQIIPVVRGLTVLFVIVFLFLSAVRFLLSPTFLELEYRMPGFPEDPYGFSFEERMNWARISLAYLITNQDIDFLARQELSEGQPLYNERELSHMMDVKFVVQKALITWTISMAMLILLGLFSHEFKIAPEFWDAFSKGGLWTIGLIVAILLAVVLNFNSLFTAFHMVFFEGDTWLFSFSDSLIRLFPIRFWQDAFILLGVLAALGGVAAFFAGRLLRKRALASQENEAS